MVNTERSVRPKVNGYPDLSSVNKKNYTAIPYSKSLGKKIQVTVFTDKETWLGFCRSLGK